jgi:uncharacterized protein YkwD
MVTLVGACSGAMDGATAPPGGNFSASAPPPAGPMATLLDAHNKHRAQHCAPPLEWSNDVAAIAQKWAEHLAQKSCKLEHSQGDLGENLAAGTRGVMTASRAVEIWYDEHKKYNYASGGFSMQTGHFTQVVWKDTTKVGCGMASCADVDVWVCNYDPPGNVEGQYAGNVSAPTCK